MDMSNKAKSIVAVAAVALAFALGRYTVPEKVKVEVRTVEVEKKTDKSVKARDKHRDTVVTEITHPDGSKETTTKTTEDTNTQVKNVSTDNKTTTADKLEEKERGNSKVTLAGIAGINPFQGTPVTYGASVTKPILGPITTGLWFLNNGTIGASLGLCF